MKQDFSKKHYLAVAVLIAIGLLLYIDTINYQFVLYDDPSFIQALMGNVHGFWHTIAWSFTSVVNVNWSPLTILSLSADYSLHGINPWGYHFTNIVLHCLNAVLLYVVLVRILKDNTAAFLVAILFLIHPINAEAVSWVSERKGLLGAFFTFLSILFYLLYPDSRYKKSLYALSALMMVAALLSKAVFVILPPILFLIEWYMSGEQKRFNYKTAIKRTVLFFVLALVVGVLTIYIHETHGGIVSSKYNPLWERLGNALNSYVVYLKQTVLPINLVAQYRYVQIPWYTSVFNLIILLSLFGVCIKFIKKRKYPIFGLLWYSISILPVIGIIQSGYHAHADRYGYFPLIGIFIVLVMLVADIFRAYKVRKHLAKAISVLVLVLFSIVSWAQHQTWRDSLTLFSHNIDVDNKNYVAYSNLSSLYIQHGKIDKGLQYYRKVVKLAPYYVNVYDTIAFDLINAGRPDQAVSVLDDLISYNRFYTKAYIEKAEIRINQGRYQAALTTLQEAKRLGLKHPDMAYLLAFAYHGLRQDGLAQESLNSMPERLRSRPKVRALQQKLGSPK